MESINVLGESVHMGSLRGVFANHKSLCQTVATAVGEDLQELEDQKEESKYFWMMGLCM